MKIFIWENVEKLTGNWHDNGGVVVMATSLEAARALIKAEAAAGCEALEKAPDSEFEVKGKHEPRLWSFPDAGCC